MENNKNLHIRISDELLEQVKKLAEYDGRSVSGYIRKLISDKMGDGDNNKLKKYGGVRCIRIK